MSRKYLVTDMARGGSRAECHQSPCFWFEDFDDHADAEAAITRHKRRHSYQRTTAALTDATTREKPADANAA